MEQENKVYNKFAIIVAGGSGKRMRTEVPKQFLELDGKPILMHTIEKFASVQNMICIVVLPEDQIDYWNDLCDVNNFEVHHRVIIGGQERFFSVKNGLDAIAGIEGIVAIHDGVRPFVSPELINTLMNETEQHGNAIPYTLPKESIREVNGENNFAVDRTKYRFIQTPQCFNLQKIKESFDVEFSTIFTDDASVFEAAGNEIHLVEGEYSNIKITTPEDLK